MPLAFPNLGFTAPISLQHAPNDGSRWYLAEQGGRIFVFENDPDATVADEFVDLRDRVHREGEAGPAGHGLPPGLL